MQDDKISRAPPTQVRRSIDHVRLYPASGSSTAIPGLKKASSRPYKADRMQEKVNRLIAEKHAIAHKGKEKS